MVSIQGSIQEADYLAALRLHRKPRPAFAVVGILLLAVALAALYTSRSVPLGMALAFLLLIFFVYEPLKAKRVFRQYKALSEPTTVELRNDGLFFKRETGEGLVPWSHVIKWRSNDELLLLYPASGLFYLLPSHFFPSSEAFKEFVTRVRSKLGKAK
jgi:YcxB-like protein